MKAPLVSIIIPTINRNDLANNCIASILKTNINSIEIIIVNDSKTSLFELRKDLKNADVLILNNPKSGVASARNFGLKKSKGDLLIFIDDDMIINSNSITNAINLLSKEDCTYNANWSYSVESEELIKVTPFGRFLIKTGYTSLKGWNTGIEWKENDLMEVNGITSQFLAMRKSTFLQVGTYNENYPFAGFEDYDLSKKLKALGIKLYIDTRTSIIHNELDRLNVVSWLERKKRGAISRKCAVLNGHSELILTYSFHKRMALRLLLLLKTPLIFTLNNFPNIKTIDPIYELIIKLMIALYIFEGYQKN